MLIWLGSEFKGEELESIKGDMEKIIGFMDKLSEVDTEDVEPLIFMNEKVNVLREDKVDQTLTKEDALLNAPKKTQTTSESRRS